MSQPQRLSMPGMPGIARQPVAGRGGSCDAQRGQGEENAPHFGRVLEETPASPVPPRAASKARAGGKTGAGEGALAGKPVLPEEGDGPGSGMEKHRDRVARRHAGMPDGVPATTSTGMEHALACVALPGSAPALAINEGKQGNGASAIARQGRDAAAGEGAPVDGVLPDEGIPRDEQGMPALPAGKGMSAEMVKRRLAGAARSPAAERENGDAGNGTGVAHAASLSPRLKGWRGRGMAGGHGAPALGISTTSPQDGLPQDSPRGVAKGRRILPEGGMERSRQGMELPPEGVKGFQLLSRMQYTHMPPPQPVAWTLPPMFAAGVAAGAARQVLQALRAPLADSLQAMMSPFAGSGPKVVRQVRIQLQPAHLGTVMAQLSLSGGRLEVSIRVPEQHLVERLRRGVEQLLQRLHASEHTARAVVHIVADPAMSGLPQRPPQAAGWQQPAGGMEQSMAGFSRQGDAGAGHAKGEGRGQGGAARGPAVGAARRDAHAGADARRDGVYL